MAKERRLVLAHLIPLPKLKENKKELEKKLAKTLQKLLTEVGKVKKEKVKHSRVEGLKGFCGAL